MARSHLRSLLVAGVAASTVALGVLPASAAPIGFTIEDETNQLASIDAGTSTVTPIGGENNQIDSLALSCNSTLYGTEVVPQSGAVVNGAMGPSDELVTIDATTGIATPVGDLGLQNREYGLAFAPDGTLWLSSGADLHTVSTTTGAATLVGSFPDSEAEMNSLAFSASGTLYGYDDDTSRLYTIDPATAVTTMVGAPVAGMGDVLGLDFDGSGTLWAIARTDGTGMATFDLTTGDGQFTFDGPVDAHGLALTALPCQIPDTTTTTSTSTTTTAPTTSTTAAPRAAAAAVVAQPSFAG